MRNMRRLHHKELEAVLSLTGDMAGVCAFSFARGVWVSAFGWKQGYQQSGKGDWIMNDFEADLIIGIAQGMLSRRGYEGEEEKFASQVLKYANCIIKQTKVEDWKMGAEGIYAIILVVLLASYYFSKN